MKVTGTSTKRFKFAEIVLVISHSNAEQERLFSIVRKNKTDSRSSLKLDRTLSNILAIKTFYPREEHPATSGSLFKILLNHRRKPQKSTMINIRHQNSQLSSIELKKTLD